MIIRRVELQHFGRFEDAAFTFSDGLNLISGPNEAGKSTLMAAIPAILFGVRDKERFRPWGREGSCLAALELKLPEHGRVRIERDILNDRVQLTEFDADEQLLLAFDGKVTPLGRSSERATYLAHLERLLGHADEELFRASLFFSQGSLEIDAPTEVTTRIKALLSGCAEIDYDQVLIALQDDYFAVTKENPWGKDKAKDRELEEVRARMVELEQSWYAARNGIEGAEQLRQEIATLHERLEQERSNLAEGRRYLDWVRRQWQLDAKEELLQRDYSRVQRASGQVGELQAELAELGRELKLIGLPRELPESLPQLLGEGASIRKQLIAQQSAWTQLRKERALLGEAPWKPVIGLSVAMLGLTALFGQGKPPILALGGVAVVVLWGFFLQRLLRLNAARSIFDGQLNQLAQQREVAKSALTELEGAFQCLGLPSSAIEMVKMEKNLERHRSVILRIKEIESALTVLEHPDAINSERSTLTRELAVLADRREQERPTLSAQHPRPEELSEIEGKLRSLAEQITAGEQELFVLTRREAALQGADLDPLQIEEEGELLREREALLVRRKEALALGCNLLRETVDEFRSSYVDRFSDEIGHYLADITRQRYEAVRLDDNFTPQVRVRGDQWQSVERLSRGAQDAVYLGVRLALTRHLTRGRHLPLLLDDPLVHLDKQRLGEALKLLERIAAEHQILIFSHSDSLLRKAERDQWRIIPLETGTARPLPISKPKEKPDDDGQQLSFL